MKKVLLLLCCFNLIFAQPKRYENRQYRQYFAGSKPTWQMKFALKGTQRVEKAVQNMCKRLNETFAKFPDDLLYTPHSFTQNVSWDDLKIALQGAQSHLDKVRPKVDEIAAYYEPDEHPAIREYDSEKRFWKKELQGLLDEIEKYQKAGIPERERVRPVYYQQPQSSTYQPSLFKFAQTKWQTTRQAQPAQKQIEQLD